MDLALLVYEENYFWPFDFVVSFGFVWMWNGKLTREV